MIREVINKEKKENNHTNEHLAQKVGCSIPTISSFLNGKKGIKYEYLIKLMEYYNISIIKRY